MSEYEPDTYLQKLGMMVMTAVLLSFVAAIGLSLMKDNGWSKQAGAMSVLALFTLICMVVVHGSRPKPARLTTISHPAPPTAPVVVPVQEASFVHKGVWMPLGEAFDVLVDY